jgi:tRNA-splicing ligase RtcB
MPIENIGKNKYLISEPRIDRGEERNTPPLAGSVIRKKGELKADILIFADEKIIAAAQEDQSIEQLKDGARLSGVISPIVGMPDLHEGYGLPIGGVMAMDEKNGLVSAGSVGYDINCGVRLLRTNIKYDPAKIDKSFLRRLMLAIEERVPTGIGRTTKHDLIDISFSEVVKDGAQIMIKKGFGFAKDFESIEEHGKMAGGSLAAISKRAIERGQKQLATLGGGNHFMEIQKIDEIYDQDLAENFGLIKGNLSVMIHTGSRGFGHQICEDYLSILLKAAAREKIYIPRRGMSAAPIQSPEGKNYLSAMAAAMNFAFANRQLITHDVREAFEEIFNADPQKDLGLELVYDVAHNSAKFEIYQGRKIIIHRKGATRAFPAKHPQLIDRYKETGHPAIIPGSMGTNSYVVIGLPKAKESFYSVNHGAGRRMSRGEAKRTISYGEFEESMGEVLYNARDFHQVVDEAPSAYKDITEVVDVLADAGLTKKVAKMKPLAVIKGAGGEG